VIDSLVRPKKTFLLFKELLVSFLGPDKTLKDLRYIVYYKMSKFLNDKYIIELNDDSKIPKIKGWNNPPYNKIVNTKNYSILTGKINNLLVVDIDLLDNKTTKNHYWNDLIDIHGKPKTLTIRTPSGGLHYYFNYDPEIKTTISLKVNNESTSIDIINESRDKKPLNIVGSGSMINEIPYKVIKDTQISNIPKWLKKYIIDNQKINNEIKINALYNKKDTLCKLNKIFTIKDNDVYNVLNLLNGEWLNDFKKWAIITNILKGLDKFELWEQWSMGSEKYNKKKNNAIWDAEIPKFDINILLNEVELKPQPYTYKYHPITDIKNIDISEQNERYVDLSKVYNIGKNKNCIIIKSDTGTGKTTTTFKTFKKNNYKYILSIVTRRSLVNQHIENAKKERIPMVSYEHPDVYQKNIVCYQLDSIMKFLTDKRRKDLNKYVVYMDEINSTLKYLINSSTMERKRIDIFHTLNYIIKSAQLIICSDADISDVVFKYLSEFRGINECVFVHNFYKNYSNINAYKCDNINTMIDKIKYKINNKIGFIACFDQLKLLDQIYCEVFDEEKKDSFLKITSRDDDFTDTEIWKNKFVFYSPKIIYGNDFVPDIKTDIFVFSKGGSIDSLQIVQQATRCRIINDLYYYIKVKPQFLKYKSIDECKNIINNEKKVHYDILKELNCIEYDEEARTNIKFNVYSDMFIYNEMVDDILKSNYLYHFEAIIKKKGFNIIDLHQEHVPVNKEMKNNSKQELIDRYKHIKECYFNKTLIDLYPQYYEIIQNRMEILNIDNHRFEINKYIDILIDDKLFKEHITTSRLFRSLKANNADYIGEMPEKQNKVANNKILLIEYIEKILNIDKFDFEYKNTNKQYNTWTLEYFKKYKSTIRNYNCKYNNSYDELYKIRLCLYKSINRNLFNRIREGSGKRAYHFIVNDEEVRKHLDLFVLRQGDKLNNVNDIVVKKYNLQVDPFIEEFAG
jgi:hypothetical protein